MGVRRFQPYPKSYDGDGKYIGKEIESAISKRHKVIAEATLAGMVKKSAARKYRSAKAKNLKLGAKDSEVAEKRAKKEYEYWEKNYQKNGEKRRKGSK